VLYRFFWSEYCDWYVEATKAVLSPDGSSRGDEALTESGKRKAESGNDQSLLTSAATMRAIARRENTLAVIDFVLSHTLRLFHPFLPFITEELWQGMGFNDDLPARQGGETIMFAHWPKPLDQDFKDSYGIDDCYLERVEAKYELVRQGRNLRREGNIPSNKKARFVLKPVNDVAPHDAAVMKILLNAEPLEINPGFEPPKGTLRAVSALGELFLPLEGLRDEVAERARLEKERAKVDAEIEKVSQKLANPSFTEKVPPKVLLEHQQRLADWNAKRQQVQSALDALAQG
jgi:valyl-tRNA synthetase